uniref:G-protein coupled receptors family 1 profile domain-containing protein n=1 Tax=Lepisosteus oculatus TaxID=7918 RepID=W5MZS0_LEPOC
KTTNSFLLKYKMNVFQYIGCMAGLTFKELKVIVFIIGFLANSMVIHIVSTRSSVRNPKNVLISHLCLVDLFGLLTFSPYFITRFSMSSTEPITLNWCLIQYYFLNVFTCIGLWMVIFMAIDRFVVICYPFDYEMKVSNDRVHKFIVICWAFAIVYPMFYIFPFVGHKPCYLITSSSFLCTGAALEASPCTVSISVFPRYYRLFMIAIHLAGGQIIVAVSYMKILKESRSARLTEASRKAMYTVVTHGIVLSIFFGNAYLLFVTGSLEIKDPEKNTVLTGIRLSADLLYLNIPPTLNPIIYGLRNEEMRKEIFKMLKRKPKIKPAG